MAKDSNIVHQYFKKQFDGYSLIVRVNPFHFRGTEITVFNDGRSEAREMEFDEDIFEDLKADGFSEASPLEFNLYFSGLA